MFYFPIVYFFLLYLELQRSDDDADSALWVCSSAGAAQRQASKMRQARASNFHSPHSLWPAGCRLLHFQPALLLNAPNSQIIGETQSVLATYSYVLDSISVRKLFIGCQVPSVLISNTDLYDPQPPSEMLRELRVCQSGVSGVLPVVVVCSCFPWPFGRRSSEMTFAKSKVAWAALNGALRWWKRYTLRASVCCARITGTVMCTNCPASKVVRRHTHIIQQL